MDAAPGVISAEDASTTTLPTDTPTYSPTFTYTSTQTDTPTYTNTYTETSTYTFTTTFTDTYTNTPKPSNTPTAPIHIVISQFRTNGPNGAYDEFVEHYNPTGAAVSISGWQIMKSAGCGPVTSLLVTIYYGTILQPGQHYLLAATSPYSSISNADQVFYPGIADNGGLGLVNSSGTIDQVGMCASTDASTYYHEGKSLTPLTGTSDQSYQHKPCGNTACYDTKDNASDFDLISPAAPLNQASPALRCASVGLASPTRTPTRTLTGTPTPGPTAIPQQLVLNEFLPHPRSDWNKDGMVNVGDEYIEIINLSTLALNMKNWILDTGADSSKTYSLPDLTLRPRQIAYFFGTLTGLSLSDGGGTIRLLKPTGSIAVALTYPAVERAYLTWCRQPDGTGTWVSTACPAQAGPIFSSIPASRAPRRASHPSASMKIPSRNRSPWQNAADSTPGSQIIQ